MVEEKAMRFNDISVISNRRHISLLTEDILYIQLSGRQSIIHFPMAEPTKPMPPSMN